MENVLPKECPCSTKMFSTNLVWKIEIKSEVLDWAFRSVSEVTNWDV